MRCKALEGQIYALARGELEAHDAAAAWMHVKSCSACRARLELASRWQEYGDALGPPALNDIRRDHMCEDTLRRLVVVPERSFVRRGSGWAIWATGVVTAALCVVLAVKRFAPTPRVEETLAVTQSRPDPADCLDRGWTLGCIYRTDTTGTRVDLPDVAALWLAPQTTIVLEAEAPSVRLRLMRGRVLAHVQPQTNGRSFAVAAGGVEATVHGTVFAVTQRVAEVAVDLVEGAVTVRSGRSHRTLAPRQHATVVQDHIEVEPLDPEQIREDLIRLDAHVDEGDSPSVLMDEPAPPRLTHMSADALYRQAEKDRSAGRHARAAQEYGEIARRFSGQAAALTALLAQGDLYLSALHQPAKALRTYDAVLAVSSEEATMGEALAGRARALRALSRNDEARAAASRYLSAFPRGVHIDEMRVLAR